MFLKKGLKAMSNQWRPDMRDMECIEEEESKLDSSSSLIIPSNRGTIAIRVPSKPVYCLKAH
jgi:hypothetical protein